MDLQIFHSFRVGRTKQAKTASLFAAIYPQIAYRMSIAVKSAGKTVDGHPCEAVSHQVNIVGKLHSIARIVHARRGFFGKQCQLLRSVNLNIFAIFSCILFSSKVYPSGSAVYRCDGRKMA